MYDIMKRTQIQLPDSLFTAAKALAERKEISLAELVRRGLEYVLAVTPGSVARHTAWELPEARALGSAERWDETGWREALHMRHLRVAEEDVDYGDGP